MLLKATYRYSKKCEDALPVVYQSQHATQPSLVSQVSHTHQPSQCSPVLYCQSSTDLWHIFSHISPPFFFSSKHLFWHSAVSTAGAHPPQWMSGQRKWRIKRKTQAYFRHIGKKTPRFSQKVSKKLAFCKSVNQFFCQSPRWITIQRPTNSGQWWVQTLQGAGAKINECMKTDASLSWVSKESI